MKASINRARVGRNAMVSLLLVSGILFLVGFACSSTKPAPSEYVGAWTGDDGSTITIRGDGSGDYKSGGTSVTNGSVEINEADKTLGIKFVGMGPSFKIDKAPSGNQMTLDGVVYKKGGSSDSKPDTSSSSKSSDTSTGSAPSTSEVEALVKASFRDFAAAVDDEDFSDFRANTSSRFQGSNSSDQLKSTFSVFIDKKDQVLPSLRDIQTRSASFSSAPSTGTEDGVKVLTADGEFPSKPAPTKFETKYEWEKSEWKVFKFKVKM